MSGNLPFLEVHGPDGQTFHVELESERLTIGRLRECNDIALQPDPQQLVTRKVHCTIEHNGGGWWAVDNGSVNGTFVRRGEAIEKVKGRTPIGDGDAIRILGRLGETGKPSYWELVFWDPFGTQRVGGALPTPYLEYDWLQARLLLIEGANKHEIADLAPQEHKLVRYMDQRNRANGGVPVCCTYEELINAVWGEEFGHGEAEVNTLVYRLRKKIEPGKAAAPRYLQTVAGMGYRLVTGIQEQ